MKKFALLFIVLAIPSVNYAQEKIVLSTPIVYSPTPNLSDYTLERFSIELSPTTKIIIKLKRMQDEFVYPCTPTIPAGKCTTDTEAETLALVNILNNANLSTRSLWRRVFDKLVADFPERFVGGATVQ